MARAGRPGFETLTDRQREVLDLIAQGLTNGQIAERLGFSLDGAKWHVSEIISRLGVRNREEAAQVWRSQGGSKARMGRRAIAIILGVRSSPAVLTVTTGALALAAGAAIIVGLLTLQAEEPRQDHGPGVPAPQDALNILATGEDVPITCSSSWEWSRPSLAEMEDNLAYVTARLGSFLPPDLFGWYLRDVQYQRITRSASLNAEFWAMSGMEFPVHDGPEERCPLPPIDPGSGRDVQAIFLSGLQPVRMRSLGSAVSVEVAEHAGWLHVIYFQAPPYSPGWERLDVVDGAGRLLYEQLREEGAEYEWELSASGALVFASVSTNDGSATAPIPIGTRLDIPLGVFASARPLEPAGVGSTAVQGTITVQDAAGQAVSEIPIEIPIEAPNARWTEVAQITPSAESVYLAVDAPAGVSSSFLLVPEDTPLPPQAMR